MTSMRGKYPGLFATLDRAIEQSGVVGITADNMYSWVASTLNRSRAMMPWFHYHSNEMMASDDGYDQVILFISGMALGRMAAGEDAKAAVFSSADDWRRSKQRPYDQRYSTQTGEALVFSEIQETMGDEEWEVWLEANVAHVPTPPAEWDGTLEDPRLRDLWAGATDKQREAMALLADGLNFQQAAFHLGLKPGGFQNRVAKLRVKAAA